MHCPEVGRSGAERWDPADSRGWLGCILIHNTHTHGGPLQTHSTACTALSENATVHFSEECLSIKRATDKNTNGGHLYSPQFFTNQHITSPEDLVNKWSTIQRRLTFYPDCNSGRFFQLYSLCDTIGLRSIQTMEVIHNSVCIHTCTLPFSNRVVLTSLRGTRRGQGSQLHNLFLRVWPGDSSVVTSENCLLITMTNKPIKLNEKQPCNKNTLSHSLECSQQITATTWFYINADSPLAWLRWRCQAACGSEWNIQSILVVVAPWGVNISRVPNMVTSQRTEYIRNQKQPMTCTPLPERDRERVRKKERRRKEGYQQPCLIRPPLRGLCSVCLHDLCKIARTFPLNLVNGKHFQQKQLKVWG